MTNKLEDKSNSNIEKILSLGKANGSEEYCYQIGFWQCSNCGTKDIYGFYQNCPQCGSSKDLEEAESEYLPDSALYYTEEMLNQLTDTANPDWICDHCSTTNRFSNSVCKNCGASKSGKSVEQITYDLDEVPTTAEEGKRQAKLRKDQQSNQSTAEEGKTLFSADDYNDDNPSGLLGIPKSMIAGGLALIIALFGLFYWMLQPRVVNAKVSNMKWQRIIEVEALKTFSESDWTLPNTARLTNKRSEIRSYRTVVDYYVTKYKQVRVQTGTVTKTKSVQYQSGSKTTSYECGKTKTGSGAWKTNYCTKSEPVYSTRNETYQEPVYGYKDEPYQEPVTHQEPIYDTKYYYDIDRWVAVNPIVLDGGQKTLRSWPMFKPLAGQTREIQRREVLTIDLVDDSGETYSVSVNEAQWDKLDLGQTRRIEIGLGKSVTKTDF